MASELEQQIATEKAEIENAPKISVTQYGPDKTTRCHWCGQLDDELQFMEVAHGQERYKGRCCRGAQ